MATYKTCGKPTMAVENSVENVWKILKTVKHKSLCLAIYDKRHSGDQGLKALKALIFKNFSYLYISGIHAPFKAQKG